MATVAAAFQAHEQYISSGKLSAAQLRDPVYRAWERSHLLGASARRAKAIQLEPFETERLLQKEQELIRAAKPYMQALSSAAGSDPHAAMLGDSRAIVLDVAGDEETVHGPVSVPGPGSLLDEAACGANGIGTPLAEGGYAELVGPEHFIGGFHPFTCQGIPIRGADGEIAGSLSISVKRVESAGKLREILICAARAVEMELLRGRIDEDLRLIAASPIISHELWEKLRQDIMQSLTMARLNFEFAARSQHRGHAEYAARILHLADRSLQTFARRGALYRSLISTHPGPEQRIHVNLLIDDLCELLETERNTGNITLRISEDNDCVSIEANAHATARTVFRALLQAFDAARGGGFVNVSIRQTLRQQGEVLIKALPGPNQPSYPLTLRFSGAIGTRFYP